MRNLTIQAAVLASLAFAATDSFAAGFVTLPTSGTSAYVQCRTSGNFGSTTDNTVPPSTDSACVAPNGVGTTLVLNSTPESGFALTSSNTTSITAFSEAVATLNERVFRNSGAGECIYAKQVLMSSSTTHDYNPYLAGNQRMEVNDYAFGGYTGTVSVAYAKSVASFKSVYRVGRTFTSVQMQADGSNPGLVASGYLVLPAAGGTAGTETNGVGQTLTPPGSPTAAQQQAPFSSSWVDFTTYVTSGIDEGGVSYTMSPAMYIRQSCASATVSVVANNFKMRQTGHETQPWVTVTASSRAPSSTITP